MYLLVISWYVIYFESLRDYGGFRRDKKRKSDKGHMNIDLEYHSKHREGYWGIL